MIHREEITTVALACAILLIIGRAMPIHAEDETATPAAAANIESETKSSDAAPAKVRPPERFDLRTSDGSVIKASLRDATIPLKTEYGVLNIPAGDIQRIDFATRFPTAAMERVKTAIAQLSDKEFQVRETASADLLALQEAAYPALMSAVNSDDPEVVMRADRILAQLRKELSAEQLEVYTGDVVFTQRSQIEGTIQAESLTFDTVPFGPQQVKLPALRGLSLDGETTEEPKNIQPDPGSLMRYQGQSGKTLFFRVTAPVGGFQNGPVWGTDMYTLDSHLSVAAVHAGLLKPGENKVIGVTLLAEQNGFEGSNRNGVSSMPWGQFPGAFRFVNRRGATAFRRAKL